MTTIRDVADFARVSPATVSLALNGRGRISPGTRRRIEQAALKVGYQRRGPGRPSSRAKRCWNLGVVLPRHKPREKIPHTPTRNWLEGARQWLTRRGDHISYFFGANHIHEDGLFQRLVESGQVEGVILGGVSHDDGYLAWLTAQATPTVVVNRVPTHHEFSFVQVDNIGGSTLAANHLIDQGHHRLALLGTPDPYSWAIERRIGFEKAIARHPRAALIGKAMLDPLGDDDAFQSLVQQWLDAGVTGVFAVNDGLALRCVNGMHALKQAVPQRLSVIGFDDAGYRSAGGLRISSVGYDQAGLGVAAAQTLVQLLSHQPTYRTIGVNVATSLALHDTTAVLNLTQSRLHPPSCSGSGFFKEHET